MKKLIICVTIVCFVLCGCRSNADLRYEKESLQTEILELQDDIANLKEEREYIQENLTEIKEENNINKYIVTFEIGQSHFTLDIGTHLKDSMNKLELDVMVSKEYYDSVEVGTIINDDFRVGSFLMAGSIGSWKVKVSNKRVE